MATDVLVSGDWAIVDPAGMANTPHRIDVLTRDSGDAGVVQ